MKRNFNTQSVYINGEDFQLRPVTLCVQVPYGYRNVWNSLNTQIIDGTPLNLITFTSADCTSGYEKSTKLTVPNDGGALKDVWVDMTP